MPGMRLLQSSLFSYFWPPHFSLFLSDFPWNFSDSCSQHACCVTGLYMWFNTNSALQWLTAAALQSILNTELSVGILLLTNPFLPLSVIAFWACSCNPPGICRVSVWPWVYLRTELLNSKSLSGEASIRAHYWKKWALNPPFCTWGQIFTVWWSCSKTSVAVGFKQGSCWRDVRKTCIIFWLYRIK